MRARVPAPRQLKRPERPLPPIRRKTTTRQWATFVKLNPKRKSAHLKRYEEEVVARKVHELVVWKQRPVTLEELLVANPGLFNRREVGLVMLRARVRHVNRYTPKKAAA